MRAIRCCVVLLLLVGSCRVTILSQQVSSIVKSSGDAVVLVVISNSDGEETALGSGFLVSADGEIVTNYHVIKDAHSAIVKLSNGAFFPVTGVLATDSDEDLAIIKVNGKNLTFLRLGDINKLNVGDHVVAIGSPLGLEGTVSDGIVSAIRDVGDRKWIQTTAPVSHGNSGGPLLDVGNEVVGVITWGVNLQLGQNLNFAIPCNEISALLISAHQPSKPLASVATDSHDSFANGVVWTSMTSGHDFKLRRDGDYLYVDWVNIPSDVKQQGGFIRGELRKGPDGKWKGTNYMRVPCTYKNGRGIYATNQTNWCSTKTDTEIDLMSDNRIEGFTSPSEKFDCKKCEWEGKTEQKPFTWIPR